jgi:hypothetical protein
MQSSVQSCSEVASGMLNLLDVVRSNAGLGALAVSRATVTSRVQPQSPSSRDSLERALPGRSLSQATNPPITPDSRSCPAKPQANCTRLPHSDCLPPLIHRSSYTPSDAHSRNHACSSLHRSPVFAMSNADFLGRAIETVKKAIETDTAGEYEKAYQLYYSARQCHILHAI